MLLPIGDDNSEITRTPYVTWGLLAANVAVFLLTMRGFAIDEAVLVSWGYVRDPGPELAPYWSGPLTLLTAMFLHADLWHLGGNMLFLWIAGDNVEDRLGPAAYLAAYLGCGVIGSITEGVLSPGVPMIGASAAIFGVLGLYVLLFPRNKIKMFYWFFFIFVGTFELSSWVVLGCYVLLNVLGVLTHSAGVGGVAYAAHLAGFAAGAALGLVVRSWDAVHADPRRPAARTRAPLFGPARRTPRARASVFGPARRGPAQPVAALPAPAGAQRAGSTSDGPGMATPLDSRLTWHITEAPEGWAVLKARDAAMNLGRAGQAIARAMRLPVADVNRFLHRHVGFLQVGLTEEEAHALHRKLRALGIDTLVREQRPLIDLPPAIATADFRVAGRTLSLLDEKGRALPGAPRDFSDCAFACAARVQQTGPDPRRPAAAADGRLDVFGVEIEPWSPIAPLRRVDVPAAAHATAVSHAVLLDLYTLDPWARYRLQSDEVSVGPRESGVARLGEFGAALAAEHPTLPANEGFRLLAGRRRAIQPCFVDAARFEWYSAWIVQLPESGLVGRAPESPG